ncbi:OsmY domain-containing protein [Rhodoferax koreense]|uniref:OsmY domain-containing protein n=1 Tax=Rhodoferax koreensis TaxID=1842727 RepID=A0A1P8JU88_9BURK|nr:BON domain-containing protein [Rhodoferax koreense]APW37261.1 OsmY domain-containing protein [Rhodoferax koreense]
MKTDLQLRDDVLAELKWTPDVDETDVGVIVKDGIVTLTGHMKSYAEKHAAERATQRVAGVKGVAVELKVQLPLSSQRTDADIAAAAERALEWDALVPSNAVRPTVEGGWVTLDGRVEWDYQRSAAHRAVRNLLGVTGVTNNVAIVPRASLKNIEQAIHGALERQAEREAKHIEVSVSGNQVTLRGKVHSWAERTAAQGAAWSAPGVATVVNHIEVTY